VKKIRFPLQLIPSFSSLIDFQFNIQRFTIYYSGSGFRFNNTIITVQHNDCSSNSNSKPSQKLWLFGTSFILRTPFCLSCVTFTRFADSNPQLRVFALFFHTLTTYRFKSLNSTISLFRLISGNDGNYHASETAKQGAQAVKVQPIEVPEIQADELKEVTDNFGQDSLIGEGSYERVYYGVLKNGPAAAIKKLDASKQSDEEFLAHIYLCDNLGSIFFVT
ncbi:uncharacterized protein, partial [Cicer arietinum]|uniref:uncharacterized protein n=1 Tax=Cicer arietinum TaxID=3827 RepID=UPI003CC57B1C